MNSTRPIILLGGGGHAKVLLDGLLLQDRKIIGYTAKESGNLDIPYIGEDSVVLNYSPENILLVNGIGSVQVSEKRKEIFDYFKERDFYFENVIHPSAIISRHSKLGEGVQIMAGSVIQTGCFIDDNTIINTRCSLDHDCTVGQHVHVAPGVTVSGNVHIMNNAHIGTGATIIQGVRIEKNVMVGAGAVVVKHINEGKKVKGVPAQEVK